MKYEIPEAIDLSGVAVIGQDKQEFCHCRCGYYFQNPNVCGNGCIPIADCRHGCVVNAGCQCGSVPD